MLTLGLMLEKIGFFDEYWELSLGAAD